MKGILVAVVCVGCAADATEPPPTTIFLTDHGADAILNYDGATGAFTGVFAAGAAQHVDRPASVQLGPDTALYSAGFGRGEVVRYDAASGAMMGVFFRDTAALEEPVELAFHGTDLVVVGNDTANAVVVDASGTMMRQFGYPTMRGAHDFVLDGDTLYVATDASVELGASIQQWDLASGTLLRAFGDAHALAGAMGLALADGILYVVDYERAQIVRFDAATGSSLGVLVDGLDAPVSVAIGPDGALDVLDRTGLVQFDRDTGTRLATLVPRDERWVTPRSFTFVPAR